MDIPGRIPALHCDIDDAVLFYGLLAIQTLHYYFAGRGPLVLLQAHQEELSYLCIQTLSEW
jgi:hypothetical protein